MFLSTADGLGHFPQVAFLKSKNFKDKRGTRNFVSQCFPKTFRGSCVRMFLPADHRNPFPQVLWEQKKKVRIWHGEHQESWI